VIGRGNTRVLVVSFLIIFCGFFMPTYGNKATFILSFFFFDHPDNEYD